MAGQDKEEGAVQELKLVREAAQAVRARLPEGFSPQIAITLGTGLSTLAEAIEPVAVVPYAEVPGLGISTVESHRGELVLGWLEGKAVGALAGRFHLYEGYSPKEVVRGVRLLGELGAGVYIVCNAAGALELSWRAGEVMLITDHINLTGENPLIGPNIDEWGERFPDMSCPYDPELITLAREAARAKGITLREGVYVGLKGPSMETPAETRMLGIIGAQAVGMSTVMEVIAARHMGMRVMGLSALSNVNDPDNMMPAPIDLIIENASRAGAAMSEIIRAVVARL